MFIFCSTRDGEKNKVLKALLFWNPSTGDNSQSLQDSGVVNCTWARGPAGPGCQVTLEEGNHMREGGG